MSDDIHYANVREFLGELIGQRIVDITQHDKTEFEEDGKSVIWLHFENGTSVYFQIGDNETFGVEEP